MSENELPLSDDERLIGELVREAISASGLPPGPFRPVILYNKGLDRIEVLIEDRSVTEVRVNEILTMMEANHALKGELKRKPVGFAIECALPFCRFHHLMIGGHVDLNELLDWLLVMDFDISKEIAVARRILGKVEFTAIKLIDTA